MTRESAAALNRLLLTAVLACSAGVGAWALETPPKPIVRIPDAVEADADAPPGDWSAAYRRHTERMAQRWLLNRWRAFTQPAPHIAVQPAPPPLDVPLLPVVPENNAWLAPTPGPVLPNPKPTVSSAATVAAKKQLLKLLLDVKAHFLAIHIPQIQWPILSPENAAALNRLILDSQPPADELWISPSPTPFKIAALIARPEPSAESLALATDAQLLPLILDKEALFTATPGPTIERPILSPEDFAALDQLLTDSHAPADEIWISPSPTPFKIAALIARPEPSAESLALAANAQLLPLIVGKETLFAATPGPTVELPILSPEDFAALDQLLTDSQTPADEIWISPSPTPFKIAAHIARPEPSAESLALAADAQLLPLILDKEALFAATPGPTIELPILAPEDFAALNQLLTDSQLPADELWISPSPTPFKIAALIARPEPSAESLALAADAQLLPLILDKNALFAATPGPTVELPILSPGDTAALTRFLNDTQPPADELWLAPSPSAFKLATLLPPKVATEADVVGEVVTLPLKPVKPPPVLETAQPHLEERIALHLLLEKTLLNPGEPAVVSITGSASFLSSSHALYVLSDPLGRQIDRGRVELGAVQPDPEKGWRFKLDPPLTLALAPLQFGRPSERTLKLRLDVEVVSAAGASYKLGGEFGVQRPPDAPSMEWDHWLSFVATPPPDGNWDALNRLGIFGGMQYRLSAAKREALRKGAAPFYVENVSRQMLSRYHTERGLWEKSLNDMLAQPGNTSPLCREPSLCSPLFLDQYAAELGTVGDAYAQDPPVFFSLSSEPSFTRLSAPADFDFSLASLEEYRRWLEREAYGTIPAVNEQWGTHFEKWDAMQPMTTDEARGRLKQGDFNFGPWIDFRAFCDYSFAKTLRDGGDTLRQRVSGAKVGITGAMGPAAFGGWDWSLLARSLDLVETYDIGCARALWRDLAPGKPALASIDLPQNGGQAGADAIARTLWPLALEGGPRGAVFWDTAGDALAGSALFDATGAPTELGTGLSALLKDFELPPARLLAQSHRAHDGVAILYSPASVRLYWLFEAEKLHGADWLRSWGGDSTAERRESSQLRLRESWTKLLDDIGIGWRFVSSEELERGLLKHDPSIKTLVLPRVAALSDREVTAIQQFAEGGGQVIADAACGHFDDHGKLRPHPPLDELFGIDSSTEPLFARPMRTLEHIARRPNTDGPLGQWSEEFVNQLPPVFTDETKWLATERSGLRQGAEYRMSPVLARTGNALYLNLDLTDYLRWRLHPDLPRANAVREALAALAFEKPLAESLVDVAKSKLPWGTQIVRLNLTRDPQGGCILALRRNPQMRLHELGFEGDSNAVFEKTEPFKLQLRTPCWLCAEFPHPLAHDPDDTQPSVSLLTGMLDPVRPTFFVLQRAKPEHLPVALIPPAQRLAPATLTLPAPETPAPAFFVVRVLGPDNRERPHYGAALQSPDGALKHTFTFALNDPAGTWTIRVQDLISGRWSQERLELGALDSMLKPAPRPKRKPNSLPEPTDE